jgi:hypothetical protein
MGAPMQLAVKDASLKPINKPTACLDDYRLTSLPVKTAQQMVAHGPSYEPVTY